ncbi:MAG: PKD domain-containing protein, partial [Bacteroidota bacterium]
SILLFLGSPLTMLTAQDCDGGVAQIDLESNEISARLTTTGNIWWDGLGEAGYEFPAGSGKHLIFNGSLWIAGTDASGSLKMAAQTYGTIDNDYDFYPGPIDPQTVGTTLDDCLRWDQFFVANREDVNLFLEDFNDNGAIDDPIPASIRGWPARGNPTFFEVHSFLLPDQSLAPFVDQNQDGSYDPMDGDYPRFKGAQAVWWVYNDVGNSHAQTDTEPIGMEIQVLAYVYDTGNDLISNSTFYEMRTLYYGTEPLNDFYYTLWIDPDIGCPNNDFIGCHPSSNLAYAYNAQAIDNDCGVLGYEAEIPMIGVKVLDTNMTPDGLMSGFSYYLNVGNSPSPGMEDPMSSPELYNYMQNLWRDGLPFVQGGNARDFFGQGDPYPFAFDNSIVNGEPWTECAADNNAGDRRMLMNFGPKTLLPGEIRFLNFAVVTKTDAVYPCPEVGALIEDVNFVAHFDSIQGTLIGNPMDLSPIAAFDFSVQANGQVQFSDASVFEPTSWNWDFGDGNTADEMSPSHTYAMEGTYTVCLTVANALGENTYCQDIVVFIAQVPVADFEFTTFNQAVAFNDLSTNDPDAWFWDFGDGTTSTSQSTIHFFPDQGVYTVCLTASNAVGENTTCKEVDLLVSVTEINALAYIVFPNPAKDQLSIRFVESPPSNLQVRIFDLLGRELPVKTLLQARQIQLDLALFPQGVYFYELLEEGKRRGSGKFVKE